MNLQKIKIYIWRWDDETVKQVNEKMKINRKRKIKGLHFDWAEILNKIPNAVLDNIIVLM